MKVYHSAISVAQGFICLLSVYFAVGPILIGSDAAAESYGSSSQLNFFAEKLQTQLESSLSSSPPFSRLCGDELVAPAISGVINNQLESWKLKDVDIEGEFALLVYSYDSLTPAGVPWHLSPYFRHYIFAWISRPGQPHEVYPVFATNDSVLFPRISSQGHISVTTRSQNSEMNLIACEAVTVGQAPNIVTSYPCLMDVYSPQNQAVVSQTNYPSQFTLTNVQWIYDTLYYSTWRINAFNQVESDLMKWDFSSSPPVSIYNYVHGNNKVELFDADFMGRLSFREHTTTGTSVPFLGSVSYYSGLAQSQPIQHYSEINPNSSYFTARTYDVFSEIHSFIATPESVTWQGPSFGTNLYYISSASNFNTASAVALGVQGDGYKIGNARMGWDNIKGLHRLVVDEYKSNTDGKLTVYEKSPLGPYIRLGEIRDPSQNRIILKKVSGNRILVQRPWDFNFTHAIYYCD